MSKFTEKLVRNAIYRAAKNAAFKYTKNKIIPEINKKMHNLNWVASGMYLELLYARIAKDTEDMVRVLLISGKRGSAYVEGEKHGFKSNLSTMKLSGMIWPIKTWIETRGIIFTHLSDDSNHGNFAGNNMTSIEAAKVIVFGHGENATGKSYLNSGREPRFFIDDIIKQHTPLMLKEVEKAIMEMEIEL